MRVPQGDGLARERHGPELLALLRVRDHGRQRHGPHGQDLEDRARAEDQRRQGRHR